MAAIAHVFTIGYVAEMLGEDEERLHELEANREFACRIIDRRWHEIACVCVSPSCTVTQAMLDQPRPMAASRARGGEAASEFARPKGRRLSVREPEHLVLAGPADRRVEQAGDADPAGQPAFDGGYDEARGQEGQ
jgi:hypothetical protein